MQPLRIALCGMPVCLAESSCAIVIPPAALISSTPSVPSVPVPDRTTPMAADSRSAASDDGIPAFFFRRPRGLGGGDQGAARALPRGGIAGRGVISVGGAIFPPSFVAGGGSPGRLGIGAGGGGLHVAMERRNPLM